MSRVADNPPALIRRVLLSEAVQSLLGPLQTIAADTPAIERVAVTPYGVSPRLEETEATEIAVGDFEIDRPESALGPGDCESAAWVLTLHVATRGAEAADTSGGEDPRAHLAALDRIRAALVARAHRVDPAPGVPGLDARVIDAEALPVDIAPEEEGGTGLAKLTIVRVRGRAAALPALTPDPE